MALSTYLCLLSQVKWKPPREMQQAGPLLRALDDGGHPEVSGKETLFFIAEGTDL